MATHRVLINGEWRASTSTATFRASNPATGQPLDDEYPVSAWADCDAALTAAQHAARALERLGPEPIAAFLNRFADRIDARKQEIAELAHLESGLPAAPRLADVELPRTSNQLRQAAAAALEGSWAIPTIDTALNIRSALGPIGPVVVFGPNNFPLAFSGVAGGDFAAAIAAGNPVIAKGHPIHPGTARLLAEEARAAIDEAGLPAATVQLIYRTDPDSGLKLVSDPRVGASAFTGSRSAGLKLKAAADAAGKPIYVELSSINPVIVLPGALDERGAALADELAGSCMMGGGQFCTNPGLILTLAGAATEAFIGAVAQKLAAGVPPPLLSAHVVSGLTDSIGRLQAAGAQLLTGGAALPPPGWRHANSLLRVSAAQFLRAPEALQTEAFGTASLVVVADSTDQVLAVLETLEGNLTGSIYSDRHGRDDALYDTVEPALRRRVGRLLNDKMPTGVAVSPAMNHGGPFPATGHPGFTAVGIPASLRRFGTLQCYDNVRPHRLPAGLRDKNPNGTMWRLIDLKWTQRNVG
jgi:NADP-dependent aldehyde dehydrogenase